MTTIITAVLVLLAAVGFSYWNFNRNTQTQLTALYSNSQNGQTTIVTADMLENLPGPVKKYLTYTGVVGKPIPKTVYLRQVGRIRQSPEAGWMDFEAVEHYSINPFAFVWIASLPSQQTPFVVGLDQYLKGKGRMTIKMLSLIPLVNAKGNEIDQGSMMRYLNEMMWFPAAYLSSNISWKAIDDTSAEVTLSDNDKTATAIMYFDEEGKLTNFVAKRYRTEGQKYQLNTWSTPLTDYGEFNGLKLPTKGKAVWNLENSEFEYIEIEVKDIQYEKNN